MWARLGNTLAWLCMQEPEMNGEQAAQIITVCAPQQVSIPEGARLGLMPRTDTSRGMKLM